MKETLQQMGARFLRIRYANAGRERERERERGADCTKHTPICLQSLNYEVQPKTLETFPLSRALVSRVACVQSSDRRVHGVSSAPCPSCLRSSTVMALTAAHNSLAPVTSSLRCTSLRFNGESLRFLKAASIDGQSLTN